MLAAIVAFFQAILVMPQIIALFRKTPQEKHAEAAQHVIDSTKTFKQNGDTTDLGSM